MDISVFLRDFRLKHRIRGVELAKEIRKQSTFISLLEHGWKVVTLADIDLLICGYEKLNVPVRELLELREALIGKGGDHESV